MPSAISAASASDISDRENYEKRDLDTYIKSTSSSLRLSFLLSEAFKKLLYLIG